MRKKLKIPYSKERVVLSDVLPYEIPLIFSNRYFYKFLMKRNKALKNEDYKNKNFKAFNELENILFNNTAINQPFRFKIKHKENDFRELNLIHPLNQKNLVDFYDKYKSLIIYYSSLSPFSIRKPTKVATFTFFNDILHKKNGDNTLEHSNVEEEDNEYENLRSFFSYQKYSNIHKFYESYQFHRSEKKFNNLIKIDISKCFDSIYSHSISWAVFNKQIVKSNIPDSLKTFPGEFDTLMQTLNANETNGIVIGPEFSRIFSELILQQIDKYILEKLLDGKENEKKLIHKKDYEIFRYVDDYFVFYNKDEEKNIILKEFKLCLKEFKLNLNENKSIQYDKPIITEISLAKQKISDLFSNHLLLKKDDDEELKNIYFSSNNVISRFKIIVKETNVDYKDIMNYSLAVLDNKTAKLIKKWNSFDKGDKVQKQFEKGFLEILDVSFFLYSVAPRVNSTIKLCLILNKIINFLKKNKSNDFKEPFLFHYKENVFKKISDEIFLILQKNKSETTTPIESLYLLIALSQLGRNYRLSIANLCSYFNIQYHEGKILINKELDYFSIVVLLFYLRDIEKYKPIKYELQNYILKKFESQKLFDWKSEAEAVLLLLDVLSCPFLDNSISLKEKNQIFDLIEKLRVEFIKPVSNFQTYSNSLKNILKELYNLPTVKSNSIDKSLLQRLSNNIKLYLNELKENKRFGNQVYKYEEAVDETLIMLSNNEILNKYGYKKKILHLLNLGSNQKSLIESEKYWFIKWTNFDFGMELQAKRSQEVY